MNFILLDPSNRTASHAPISCTTTYTSLLKYGASSSFYARLDTGSRTQEWPRSIHQGSADKDKHLKCHLQVLYGSHCTQGNKPCRKVTSQAKTDFAALSALFLEERNVKRKLATWLHSSSSQPLSQTGLLPIQSEDWKGRLGSRHTAMAMGEDITSRDNAENPNGWTGMEKSFLSLQF